MRSFLLMVLLSPCAMAQESFLDEFRHRNLPERDAAALSEGRSSFVEEGNASFDAYSDDEFGEEESSPLERQLTPAAYEPVDIPDSESSDRESRIITDAICAEQQTACEPTPQLVRFRKGPYQGSNVAAGYIHDDSATGVAVSTLDVNAVFAVPLGSMDNLLILTPYVRADYLNSAPALDLPDAVYDTGVKAFWKKPINDRLSAMFLFTPSMRTDFDSTSGAFRLFGMGLLVWQAVPEKLSLSGGVVYTGRDDFPVLPGMGVLWTPTPDWRYDIQFPSPRISHRLQQDPGQSETWAYVSGVFGGNTWSVQRPSGASDELTMSDLRVVLGIERIFNENRGYFGEVGCVFNRYFEYASLPAQTDLDATWMLRAGISF